MLEGMIYIIFNIGNSDVQLNRQVHFKGNLINGHIPSNLARAVGEHLLQNYDEYKPYLSYPIVLSVMPYILRDLDQKEEIAIGLVVSDQVDNEYRSKDTIFYGKLIERFLNMEYKNMEYKKPISEKLKVGLLKVKENPADYDNMNRWFDDHFRKLAIREHSNPIKKLFISLAGGTPAMNTFALIHGVGYFGERTEILYVSPRQGSPIPMRVGQDLIVNNLKKQIAMLVRHYNFFAAIKLAQELKDVADNKGLVEILIAVLNCAYARISFDFDLAAKNLEKAIRLAIGDRRDRLLRLRKEMSVNTPELLLKELFFNARLKDKQGDYIDFIGRIFRLQEETYRLIAEKKAGVIFTSDTKQRLDNAWLNSNSGLKVYLDNYQIDGSPLNYSGVVNRQVMRAILKYYAQDNPDIETFLAVLEKIEKLAQLRNQTLIAHGHKGVTREIIEQCYPEGIKELLKLLEDLIKAVAGDLGDQYNFYKENLQEVESILAELR